MQDIFMHMLYYLSMHLSIAIRSLSKKKAKIVSNDIELEHPDSSMLLSDLISKVVEVLVLKYNRRVEKQIPSNGKNLNPIPVRDYLNVLANSGKVGFNVLNKTKSVGLETSVEVALQGFEDGLYAVFVGDEEQVSLDTPIQLKDGLQLSFIRLTFLAGSYW